jgi:hypothetical protein
MYVLVNTETTDVEKYNTLDDLITACTKKNGILHTFTKIATSLVGGAAPAPVESAPLPASPTVVPEEEKAGVSLEELEGERILQTISSIKRPDVEIDRMYAFNWFSSDRVDWNALDDARRWKEGAAVEELFQETIEVSKKQRAEQEEDGTDDRTLNTLEALGRYDDLKRQLETQKSAPRGTYSHAEQTEHNRHFYEKEFVKRFCNGSSTDPKKLNFAQAAFRLIIDYPEKFDISRETYKDFFSLDRQVWSYIRSVSHDGRLFPVFGTFGHYFEDFNTITSVLQTQFENQRFNYNSVEDLVYLSSKAVLTGDVRVELLEKWITAFLCKSTKLSQEESIKSSTLYDAFLKCLKTVIDSKFGPNGPKLLGLLTGNISQKIFSRILKSQGWKSKRSSDGIYWQSIAFDSSGGSGSVGAADLTQPSYTDTVAAFDEGEGLAPVENFNPGIPPSATRAALFNYKVKHPLSVAGDGEIELTKPEKLPNSVLGNLRKKSQGAAALRSWDTKDFA